MIQRPWDDAFDEYLTYTLRDQSEKREHAAAELKYTDAGRKVYSGGGIEPDNSSSGPVQGFNPTRFGRSLVARAAFANFAERYAAEGDTRMSAATEGAQAPRARLRRDRRDGRGLQGVPAGSRRSRSTRRRSPRTSTSSRR